jgi:hypothetical protein
VSDTVPPIKPTVCRQTAIQCFFLSFLGLPPSHLGPEKRHIYWSRNFLAGTVGRRVAWDVPGCASNPLHLLRKKTYGPQTRKHRLFRIFGGLSQSPYGGDAPQNSFSAIYPPMCVRRYRRVRLRRRIRVVNTCQKPGIPIYIEMQTCQL